MLKEMGKPLIFPGGEKVSGEKASKVPAHSALQSSARIRSPTVLQSHARSDAHSGSRATCRVGVHKSKRCGKNFAVTNAFLLVHTRRAVAFGQAFNSTNDEMYCWYANDKHSGNDIFPSLRRVCLLPKGRRVAGVR